MITVAIFGLILCIVRILEIGFMGGWYTSFLMIYSAIMSGIAVTAFMFWYQRKREIELRKKFDIVRKIDLIKNDGSERKETKGTDDDTET